MNGEPSGELAGAVEETSPHRLRRAVLSTLLTLLVAGLVLVMWPSRFGGCTTLAVVNGHSMEPTFYRGDLVVARCGKPHIGDVAVYANDDTGGARIVHRIVAGDGTAGWTFQGDNNSWQDPFSPTDDDVLGEVLFHIPKVGGLFQAVNNPMVWMSLLLLGAGLFLWPSRSDEEDERAFAPVLLPAEPVWGPSDPLWAYYGETLRTEPPSLVLLRAEWRMSLARVLAGSLRPDEPVPTRASRAASEARTREEWRTAVARVMAPAGSGDAPSVELAEPVSDLPTRAEWRLAMARRIEAGRDAAHAQVPA